MTTLNVKVLRDYAESFSGLFFLVQVGSVKECGIALPSAASDAS